jgi:hypothetical protein
LFPGISVTVRGQQKPKDLSVKVELSDVRIRKQKFKDKLLSKIQFNPPWWALLNSSEASLNSLCLLSSINVTSTLTVRLCESHLFREEVLTRMEFTVDMAQGMLGLGTEVKGTLFLDILFSPANSMIQITLSFRTPWQTFGLVSAW